MSKVSSLVVLAGGWGGSQSDTSYLSPTRKQQLLVFISFFCLAALLNNYKQLKATAQRGESTMCTYASHSSLTEVLPTTNGS